MEDLQNFLKEQEKRRARGLPPRNWKILKKRRLEVKSKLRAANTGWLRS
jgi:hypothetical protein